MRTITGRQKSPQKSPQPRVSSALKKSQSFQTFQIAQIKQMVNSFRKEVQMPCEFELSVLSSRTPQRCHQHNNVLTLYCINDRKPLCVTCMYQTLIHKKHKVIPLNRAAQQIEYQLKGYLHIIQNKLVVSDQLIKKGKENLERANRQFPEIINNVYNFYQDIIKFLTQKKNQQIKYIEKAWQKSKLQYANYINQFSKINLYTIDKLKEIGIRSEEEYLLYNRNVASNLVKIDTIINKQMCQYREYNFVEEIERLNDVKVFLTQRLNLKTIFSQKRTKSKNSLSPKIKQKTPQKIKQHLKSITKEINETQKIPMKGIIKGINQNIHQSPIKLKAKKSIYQKSLLEKDKKQNSHSVQTKLEMKKDQKPKSKSKSKSKSKKKVKFQDNSYSFRN